MPRKSILIEAPVPLAINPDDETQGADYAIFDLANPRSVVNIVPTLERQAILGLGPEWRNLSEREVFRKCKPDPLDARLRLAFWDEYSMAQDKDRFIKIINVVRNICPIDYWETRVVVEQEKLAFIILPPRDYISSMKALLDQGLQKLEDVLSLDIVNTKGQPNVRLIAEMVKIVQMLDIRVKGAVLQKIRVDQRSVNLNMNHDASGGGTSLEELDEQIKRVQERLHSAMAAPQIPEIIPALDISCVEVPVGGAQENE
jgi:hypothetical protein